MMHFKNETKDLLHIATVENFAFLVFDKINEEKNHKILHYDG